MGVSALCAWRAAARPLVTAFVAMLQEVDPPVYDPRSLPTHITALSFKTALTLKPVRAKASGEYGEL